MPTTYHRDNAPSVSHDEYRGKSLKQCFFRRFIRCPRLLSKCNRPVVQNNGQLSPPTLSASPPVESLAAAVAPSPTPADVTLAKLIQRLQNKERLPTHDMIEMLGFLLNMDDFVNLSDKIDNQQDAENLIEILLYLFDMDSIGQMGMSVSDINISRARRLVIKSTQRLITAPKFLVLNPNDIPIPTGLPIDDGGLAFVYKSSYRGLQVALKRFRSGKIDKDFLQEALTWRTLSHKYILPFIGIFVDHSESFISLVAPFMENGTLRDWRQNTMPSIAEVKKRIQEVAEGLLYLHAEGVVHGDLKGTNVLLDSEFHVRISDFGSTRHSDSTGTKTWAITIRFAAPELFSDEEDQALLKRTREADIYAFGCLYYEIHFGVLPFFDSMSEYSIMKRVKEGTRPTLHRHPRLDDNAEGLITQCWDQDPSERPRIEDVVYKFMCLGL